MRKKIVIALISAMCVMSACTQTTAISSNDSIKIEESSNASDENKSISKLSSSDSTGSDAADEIDTDDMFTGRDLTQSPDLSQATYIEISDNNDVTIDSEGIYVLSGQAKEVTIYIEAKDDEKIQLVLDGLSISNNDKPCIYVKSADKVFVTTVSDDNSLTVENEFTSDNDTNTDAVIFSKEDLVLNGTGTLNIVSSDNGITSKDTLKITGGTINIDCKKNAIEAHDAIMIADGDIKVNNCNDGLHAEDDDNDATGYIYIKGGRITINASDDAIHATTIIKIDDGSLDLKAAEGIEATVIQINSGEINIDASDDGINAAQKSDSYSPLFEMNGGDVTIVMGAGDTDGVDSNGDITINGGTINISGQSTFDYDGKAQFNGGTIIENGSETNTITNQTFGGKGGMGGQGNFERNDNMSGMDMPDGQNGFERPQMPDGEDMMNGVGGDMKQPRERDKRDFDGQDMMNKQKEN